MEADYKDFMSIEIEEGISINIKELSPKRNELSSLSPLSTDKGTDKGSSESLQIIYQQRSLSEKKKPTKNQLSSFNIRPFYLIKDEAQNEFEENVDIDELL